MALPTGHVREFVQENQKMDGQDGAVIGVEWLEMCQYKQKRTSFLHKYVKRHLQNVQKDCIMTVQFCEISICALFYRGGL